MVREEVPEGYLASGGDGSHRKTNIFRIEQIALFAQCTQFIDQILRLAGSEFITLDENLVPSCAYGNTKGLFDELEILGETAIQEGEFLFDVEIYLCGNRIGSFLFLFHGKGIKAVRFLKFECKHRCLFPVFEFAASHFKKKHTFRICFFLY